MHGKTNLPLARKNLNGQGAMANQASLLNLMSVVTLPDVADYLVSQFEKRMNETKSEKEYAEVYDKLKEYRDFVVEVKGQARGKPWDGQWKPVDSKESDFVNWLEFLAKKAAAGIQEQKVQFDFAISSVTDLLRGYSANGQPLSEEKVAALDKAFNAWLASEHMISKQGVIYESTPDGKIKEDKQGAPIRKNPEELDKLITEKLPEHAKKNNKLEIVPVKQAFPEQKPAQQNETSPSST